MIQQEPPQPLTQFLPKDFVRAGQTLEEALNDNRMAARAYQEWLTGTPGEALHRPAGPQHWSPAQHADHITKGVHLIAGMLRACADGRPMPEMPMGYRDADERLATAALRPDAGRDRPELTADFETAQRELESAVAALREAGRLEVCCVATGLFSPLNTLEAVQLCAGHYAQHMPEGNVGSDHW